MNTEREFFSISNIAAPPSTASFDPHYLTLESTLADLPTYDFRVNGSVLGQQIASRFELQPDLPGVIVIEQNKVSGAFSRRKFLERVSRPYGIEIYLKRPVRILLNAVSVIPLELPSRCPIHQAAQTALSRPPGATYEPVVVTFPDGRLELLDLYTLLLAQSHLLSLGYKLEQNRRQFAEALQKTGRALSSSLKLHEVTNRILKELATVVQYRRGAVMIYTGEHLEMLAQRGFPDDPRTDDLMVSVRQDRRDVFQRMLRTFSPVVLNDVTTEPGWEFRDWLPLHHSWLGVPLIAQDQVIGMVSLTRARLNGFTQDDANTVMAFAGQAAVALENARLYDHILRFNDQLEQMVSQRTEELNRAYHILEKLDRTKSDFINVAAHELRTPLTVIKGYAQILNVNPSLKEDENAGSMLSGIVTGVDRLYQIVNSMLDVARIDNDNLKVYPEPVTLATMIEDLAQKFTTDLAERQLTLTIEDLSALPTIQADPELLQKVFQSLLLNAIKYTPDGGAITIGGHRITLEDEAETAGVQLIFSDTGIGIDPEHHDLIFEKFYQTGKLALHSSGLTKFKGAGPGLGLAIARGVIEAHDGQVWVESDGHDETHCPGSRFYVQLPLK